MAPNEPTAPDPGGEGVTNETFALARELIESEMTPIPNSALPLRMEDVAQRLRPTGTPTLTEAASAASKRSPMSCLEHRMKHRSSRGPAAA